MIDQYEARRIAEKVFVEQLTELVKTFHRNAVTEPVQDAISRLERGIDKTTRTHSQLMEAIAVWFPK